jgi:hypothetical protein
MRRSKWLWRWRNNPLRRRSYLVEGWVLIALGTVTPVAAVLVAMTVTGAVGQHLNRQRFDRHAATAVLTGDASDTSAYGTHPRARVRWTAPDGQHRTGVADVSAGLESGAHVTVWTNTSGALVSAPPSRSQARLEAAASGLTAAGGIGLVALVCWGAATSITDRKRADRWAAEWTETGPHWDHRNA